MTKLAKLVAATIPVIDEAPEIDSGEAFVAYAARVSNPSNQTNPSTAGLVKYLIKHKHWSPFEMVHVCIEINTTRDIARQILRHRSFSFQEFSQRYADASQLGFVTKEARLQDTKNRQNSISEGIAPEFAEWWELAQKDVLEQVKLYYQTALDSGIAKEVARVILPEGLTKSKLYMSGTLRSWIHYCELRMSNGTQKEHMEVAKECWEELRKEFPNIIEACEEAWET
jgi:thymidylate synthase (FAD)